MSENTKKISIQDLPESVVTKITAEDVNAPEEDGVKGGARMGARVGIRASERLGKRALRANVRRGFRDPGGIHGINSWVKK